ncbi:iron ABC transporter permease [Streptococcus oralis]|uniref:Iron ABC transporter permease n=1 Tax=Streptococcus oralis TaxID=1303 RepID=A0A4Q2FR64_STROR|nr:iron ABC transporter permease [Streptococcus oralis]RXX22465.1 iron ABC transporter permease [Streptococcus oralis]
MILLLTIFLACSLFLAVSLGSVTIDIQDTYQIIFSKLGFSLGTDKLSPSTIAIVWNMRVPRVILGILAGAGLSVCGSVMQSTVNNPIEEPYILGISAGETLGSTLSIILGLKSITGTGAFIGAILASAVVLFIAFSNFIISVGANADSLMTIKFWTMGSLAGTSWSDLALPALVVGLSFLFFCSQYRIFNTMMMGDEAALTLGVPLHFYWFLYITVVAIMTAVLVACCGIIGFVGLITPHIARRLASTNYKRLFPIATLLGSLFLVWADVLARILVKNTELPIGIFTALVGAHFFIYIVAKSRKEISS